VINCPETLNDQRQNGGNHTSGEKTSRDKKFEKQSVQGGKTSGGTNVWKEKNVRRDTTLVGTKCPEGQNVRWDRMSLGKNI
jgi:hypothetical protein